MDPRAATSPVETMSEPMRQVMEALVAGLPAPPDAQAALTEAEQAEVAALVRTAHLTRLSLDRSRPPEGAEDAARARAEAALAANPPDPAEVERFRRKNPEGKPAGGVRTWLDRVFHRTRSDD